MDETLGYLMFLLDLFFFFFVICICHFRKKGAEEL